MFPISCNAFGDILAVAQLIRDLAEALNETRGAAQDCREFAHGLDLMASMMKEAYRVADNSLDSSLRETLLKHIRLCCDDIKRADQLTTGFDALLSARQSDVSGRAPNLRNRLSRGGKMLQWHFMKASEAAEFTQCFRKRCSSMAFQFILLNEDSAQCRHAEVSTNISLLLQDVAILAKALGVEVSRPTLQWQAQDNGQGSRLLSQTEAGANQPSSARPAEASSGLPIGQCDNHSQSTSLDSNLFGASSSTVNVDPDRRYKVSSSQQKRNDERYSAPTTYQCRVLQVTGLPVQLGHFRTTKYTVEVSIGSDVRRTRQALHGPNPRWDETLFESFSTPDEFTPVTMRVIRMRHATDHQVVANKTLALNLHDVTVHGAQAKTWFLNCLGNFEKLIHSQVKITLGFARNAPQISYNDDVPTKASISEDDLYHPEQSSSSQWGELVSAMQGFLRAVEHISEVHPDATVAYKLLLSVPEKATNALERDKQVNALCTVVKDALLFVTETEPLHNPLEGTYSNQVQILLRITHQITECFRFLRTYADELGACLWSDSIQYPLTVGHADKHVQRYKEIVEYLLSSFRDRALVEIQIKVHHHADLGVPRLANHDA